MSSKNLTAEQRIERAHSQLMRHKDFCLFSGVFMVGKVVVNDTTPTAFTNGRDVTYGRDFVNRLDDKQLAFLVVHEAMHKAYRHLMVWKNISKENPQLANAAMDFVINLQIVDSDKGQSIVSMPRDAEGKLMGLLDEKYRDMDTRQVYELLKKDCQDQDGSGGKGGNGKKVMAGDGNFDDHDWEGAEELTEEEAQELANEIDHALREGSILAGKMKGNVMRGINEMLHPKVDWKEALREFVKSNVRGGDQSTWRRPNRRYLGIDIVMPTCITQKAERFSIGVDTSGSIGGAILGRFLGESKSICDEVMPEIVDILYWDTHVAKHEMYCGAEVQNFADSTSPAGGGGTTPECVPEFMLENKIKPQALIMLTDGYFYGRSEATKWAELGVPVLWCVIGNKEFTPMYGQSVLVEGDIYD
jgi:predicted metal-dependent peptidase